MMERNSRTAPKKDLISMILKKRRREMKSKKPDMNHSAS